MYKPKYLTREFVVYRDPKLDARSEFSGGGAVKIIKRILSPDGLRRLAKSEGISEKDVEKFLSGEYATLKRDQARGLVKRDKDGNIVVKDKYSEKYDPLRRQMLEDDARMFDDMFEKMFNEYQYDMYKKSGRKPNSGGGIVQREAFGKGSPRKPFTQEELDIFNTVNQTKYKLGEDQKILDKFGKQYTIQKANIRTGSLTAETRRGIGSTGIATENPAYVKETAKVLKPLVEKKRGQKFISFGQEGAKYNEFDLHKKLKKSGVIKIKNREYLNKLIANYMNENEVVNLPRYRASVVVKSFLNYLNDNQTFDGGEKLSEDLKEFHGKPGHKYENINRYFTNWREGKIEVIGIDRSTISKENLNEINNWEPGRKQERSGVRTKQFKTLDTYNNNPNLTLKQVKSLFNKKHGNDENFNSKTFLQRIAQLTQIKQSGGVGNSNTGKIIKYSGLSKGPRSPWLKQGLNEVIAGNYAKMIIAGDQLMDQGKTKKAKILYKTAEDFFGPKGKFTKMRGQGEHPLPRSIGGPDVELKINSLVSEDLNNFKRNNFDVPIKQFIDQYNKPGTSKARKKELQNAIELRKNFVNSLTSSPEFGGILDPVKFNFGDKVTYKVDVKDIDKYPKDYSFDEFVKKGDAYRQAFLEKGKKFVRNGTIQDVFATNKQMRQIANKLENNPKLLDAAVKSGFKCRKKVGGPISIECIADDITKTTEDALKGTTIEKNNANTKLNRLFKRAPSVIKQGGKTVVKGAGATLAAVGGWPALVAEAGLEGLLVAADMAFTGKDFDEAYRDNTLVLGGIFAPGSGEDIAIGKAIQGNNAATRYFEASKKLEKYNNLKSDLSNYEDDQEAIGSGLYDQKLDELSRLENEIAPVKDELKRILTPGSYESNEYERMLTEQASERSKKVYTQADDTAFLEVGPTPDEVEQSRAEDFKETVELISKPTQEEVTDKQREQFREVLTKQIGQKQGGLPDLKPGQSPFYDFIVQAAIESKVEPRLLEEYVRSLDLFTPYDAKFANGGRVRFRGGGMTRRGFLKLAAGIATLVGAVKTGIVKLTTPIAKQVLKDAPQGTPDWFAPLVEKIVKEGVEAGETMKTVTGRETVKKLEVPNPESDGVLTDKYFLYENPDTGEIRIEIDSPGLGANDGEFSLYMRPSRVDGVNDDGTPMIDEGEFFVTEDRVVGRATSPDDYDIDLEPFDTDLEGSASNWHKVEEFATGKTDKKAQAKQLEKKERIEAFPHEDITDRYGDYDPPDPDDY